MARGAGVRTDRLQEKLLGGGHAGRVVRVVNAGALNFYLLLHLNDLDGLAPLSQCGLMSGLYEFSSCTHFLAEAAL